MRTTPPSRPPEPNVFATANLDDPEKKDFAITMPNFTVEDEAKVILEMVDNGVVTQICATAPNAFMQMNGLSSTCQFRLSAVADVLMTIQESKSVSIPSELRG